MREKIQKLEAEAFGIYTTINAIAMVNPRDERVIDGIQRLAQIKRRIERLELRA